MDLSALLAGPLGGILGLAGSIAQRWLGMREKKADHEMKLKELEIMSKIDLQKADINFRQTVEEKQGESFKAAIDAQTALKPSSPWANNFLSLFRPGLTLALMITSTAMAVWFRNSKPELIEFIVVSMFTMSSVATGYWFGVRNDEKQRIQAAFSGNRG